MKHVCISLLALGVFANLAPAELVSIDWHTREPFAGGLKFGDVGAYEKLVGIARFTLDPRHSRNTDIVDLDKAKRNELGLVEFACDVCILKPIDLSKGNGAILYDVNNRGNKLALGMFNGAGGNELTKPEHAGNGFLMRRGYTIVWCGWIGELLAGNHRLLLQPPLATEKGKPITGVVRYEMVADKAATSQPLSRREGHGSYSPTIKGEKEGVLTWRMRETDARVVIPREQWSLERLGVPETKGGVPGTLAHIRLKVVGGFRPGYIYELICEAEGPIVQGTGFAAVRDLISFLKYDASEKNPLLREKKSAITRAHGFGVSQSGRFLRHFVYQGFNVDEHGRKVFDGLMPHVAGGGLGFFNHRFAQPTRHCGQHEEHLYPCDVFPFTYGISQDEYLTSGGFGRRQAASDGICLRTWKESATLLPKIMHTQSAAEYWHRAGSLVHTDTRGQRDVDIPDNVRIYSFGGTQHGPAGLPLRRSGADNLPNPGDYRPFLRALLDALDDWVREGTSPPPSVYPRIQDGTLVDPKQAATRFPPLPGVRYPEVIQQPPAFELNSKEALPRILGPYRVLVPKCDVDGNDLGTLLPVEVHVPVATYTGWNLRRAELGAEGMLMSLMGSYIPFPRDKAQRLATGDPRVSVMERYGTFDEYNKRWQRACEDRVTARYLLREDVERMEGKLKEVRDLFPK